ncbi:MAG: hypothetical protein H0V54_16685 [Chthoniobacterales bacterium]|nr:hypothetical protein [Chthoniobacterales bacterium]
MLEVKHALERAEQWLREGLVAAVFDEKELATTLGSDPRKSALARLLWRGTTVSQVWLAERLSMRSAAKRQPAATARRDGTIKRNVPKRLDASWSERWIEISVSRFAH